MNEQNHAFTNIPHIEKNNNNKTKLKRETVNMYMRTHMIFSSLLNFMVNGRASLKLLLKHLFINAIINNNTTTYRTRHFIIICLDIIVSWILRKKE